MILNVSGRTDIVAFYTPWFMNRYRKGFVDVRNPFNPKLISRIYFDNVDLIVFCTKNPLPIIKYVNDIQKPILFFVTLTPYKNDIEVNVKEKKQIIEAIKSLSNMLGKDNVIIRYDPIFISDKYNIQYHIKAFSKICLLLHDYVNKIIISFLDEYKNVERNYKILNYRKMNETDYYEIGTNFMKIANQYGLVIQTCCEERNLSEFGFIIGDCISTDLAYKLTGKKYGKWKARKSENCNCVKMVDIGVYNSCKHYCKYCYANYDEKLVEYNYENHNVNSSLLIGDITDFDIIKIREK